MTYILEYCKKHLSDDDYIFVSTFLKNCSQSTQSKMEIVTFKKKQPLMQTGYANTYVYILLKGKVDAVDEKVPNIPFSFGEYKSIDVLGDYELFSNAPVRFISLNAISECTCIRIHSNDYMNWVKDDVNALFIRMNMLMTTLSRETQVLRQFMFLDMETRVIVYFYEEYQKHDIPKSLKITTKREGIASKMACSVRTLNRTLQKVEKKGLITRENRKIHISLRQYKLIEAYIGKKDVVLYSLPPL